MYRHATRWLQQTQTRELHFPALFRVIKLFQRWLQRDRPGAEPAHNSHTRCNLSTPQHCMATHKYGWVYVVIGRKRLQQRYVGWTTQSLSDRFWQHATKHINSTRTKALKLQRCMQQEGIDNFIILGLERVSCEKARKGSNYVTRQRRREQAWQNTLQTLTPRGLNTIRVIRSKHRDTTHSSASQSRLRSQS